MIALLVLFAVAGAFTSLWLGGAAIYVSRSLGWGNLLSLPPSDLALFVAGTFGPVVALWLIVAFVQQGLLGHRHERILSIMLAQGKRASDQIEAQVRTLIQMQEESRRRSVIDGMDLVLKDLNGQAAVLAERLGMVSQDEADTLWARTVSGDVWAFSYAFLTRAAAYPDFPERLAERLAQDDISTGALQIFLRRYDKLLESFKVNDADKLAREVLEDGPLTRLHTLFADVNARAVRLRHRREETGAERVEPAAPAGAAGRLEPMEGPLPTEAREAHAFTPLAREGERLDDSMNRLQETLRRMNDDDIPSQDPAAEPPPGFAGAAESSAGSAPTPGGVQGDLLDAPFHGEARNPETAPPSGERGR